MVSVGLSQPTWFCISSVSVLCGEVVSSVLRRGGLFFQTFLPYLEIHLHDGKSCKSLSAKNDSAAEHEILANK